MERNMERRNFCLYGFAKVKTLLSKEIFKYFFEESKVFISGEYFIGTNLSDAYP